MLGKVYLIVFVACIALVLGLLVFTGILAAKGMLSGNRIRAAVAALTTPSEQEQAAASQPSATEQSDSLSAGELLAEGQQVDQAMLRRYEMYKRQLANEQALLERARFEVQREREAFEQGKKQWFAARQQEREKHQASGIKKELEYLSSVSAKQALALLRQKQDADAAQILMVMQTRTGKKIIEQCKKKEEQEWAVRILELIRQQDNVQAAAMAGG